MNSLLESIRSGLAVSCQAYPGEPFYGSVFMAKMALAAKMGGAVAVRGNGISDIAAIRAQIDLPIIGINKKGTPGVEVTITPDFESVAEIIKAGADIVALDCTRRKNYLGLYGVQVLREIKGHLPNLPLMAEISVLEEAVAAAEAGADIISTTLSGYTVYSPQQKEPDFRLIEDIRRVLPGAFINAEGRISNAEELCKAFRLGADIVTIGGAITRPQWITEQLVRAIGQ